MNAIKSDIADIALAGRLFAPHYARAQTVRCAVPSVPMYAAPSTHAAAVSELRLGDEFAQLDRSGGWAWGYSLDDHYVGYVPAPALGESGPDPTYIAATGTALVFAAPDIKSPVVETWPMGARFAGTADGAFVATPTGFVHHRHARPIDETGADPAAAAERLLGAPYRWGGRSGTGIDCSGLIQLALALCGSPAPRDSDQQCAALGTLLADDAPLRRNDIVFFSGHVGIMADAERLIHANAHWMAVTAEPLADVVARNAAIVARKRLP